MIKVVINVFVVLFLLISCSTGVDDAVVTQGPSAQELYDEALAKMNEKKFLEAVETFQEIERKYPFSPLATRAQVMAGYAYYQDVEYDDAIDVLERFISLHPGNKDIAYAYYLKALCYYERIADVKRDQKMTKLALNSLNDVVARFPDTDYARDANLKLDLVNDHLAGKEMEIGRFYQDKGDYVAAINRFKVVVNDYDTTSHIPEALYRLTEVYLTLGAQKEARKYASVLGFNFNDSKWYKFAYRLTAGGAASPLPPQAQEEGYFDNMFSIFEDDEDEVAREQNIEGESNSLLDIF